MITAAIEPYSSVIEEIKPLFPAHWEEVAIFKDKMPLAPRYQVYRAREAAGELVMAILRQEGRAVGYWPTFVAPGLHYGETLTATMDILYIEPQLRRGGAGRVLFDCLLKELKRRGVQVWYAGSKNHKEIEAFLEACGFEPVERYFAQWIGD